MASKSMRTAFIRVSKVNETKKGTVTYTYDDVKNIVSEWSKTKNFKYYVKDHNNEKGDENPHYHLVLKFSSPTPFEDIKNHFPYGDIENAKNIKKCVQYLVHMNDLSKTQYDFSSIFTNDDNIGKYAIMSYETQMMKLDDYINRIAIGEIREYNLTDHIPPQIFAMHKNKIINALEYYRRIVMTNKDRNINVLFFSGETGTFKTTYAKQFAKNKNKSICISSSSNDPMQDYKGEDVLVLDDIRDDTFKFHDLLKVLDNHTNSTVQSRYNNKAFIGDTIIITSSQPLSEWYFDLKKEDKVQLYRRIKVQMQFTNERIKIFEFNEQARKYIPVATVPNINNFKPAQAKTYVLDSLKSMGVELSEETMTQFNKDIERYETPQYKDLTLAEISESDDIPF